MEGGMYSVHENLRSLPVRVSDLLQSEAQKAQKGYRVETFGLQAGYCTCEYEISCKVAACDYICSDG